MAACVVIAFGATKTDCQHELKRKINAQRETVLLLTGYDSASVQWEVIDKFKPSKKDPQWNELYAEGMRWVGVARVHA